MEMITVTQENFEKQVLHSGRPVMVDFWAPWCVYCRRIAPAVGQLADEQGERLGVGKINIDEQPALAGQFQVETIPTLMLFREGKAIGPTIDRPLLESADQQLASGKRRALGRGEKTAWRISFMM